MPTYEYRCRDCGEELEAVQSFTDDALTECPACGGSLRKVFGNIGITFKGSGFYKTDARNGSSTKAGGAKPTDTSSGSGTSSDSSSSSSDSGSKDSGSKDSGSKDSGSKDSASKASA